MADLDVIAIHEALLNQHKLLREVKLQVESLKSMMFEHRPQFVPAFEEQVQKLSQSDALRRLDTDIKRLESKLDALRKW